MYRLALTHNVTIVRHYNLQSMSVITIASLPLTVVVPVVFTLVNPFKPVLSTVTVWLPPDTP